MRRADRLFDVIQVLRTAKKPVTAAAIAEELEVTVRTIYRDVATLQARLDVSLGDQLDVSGQRVIWLMNGTSYSSYVDMGIVATGWGIANY
jgi:hypothetical protein